MSDLTPAEVLEIFIEDVKELDITSFKILRREGKSLVEISIDMELSPEDNQLLEDYFKLQDRLYQHLGRHPEFAEKSNGNWRIPKKNLRQIAYWAIKSPNDKRTNKNLMLTSQIVEKLSKMQKGQMSTVVDFSLELLFSLIDRKDDGGESVRIVSEKLRLFCKLYGVREIDERLDRLAA